MSRLPTVTARRMVALLKRAGFIEHHSKGSHIYLWHPSKKVITSVAMHATDLKRPVMKAILQQAGLNEKEFRKLL